MLRRIQKCITLLSIALIYLVLYVYIVRGAEPVPPAIAFDIHGTSTAVRGERIVLSLVDPLNPTHLKTLTDDQSVTWSVSPASAQIGLDTKPNRVVSDFVLPFPGTYLVTVSLAGVEEGKAVVSHQLKSITILADGQQVSQPDIKISNAPAQNSPLAQQKKTHSQLIQLWTKQVNRYSEAQQVAAMFMQRAGQVETGLANPNESLNAIRKVAADTLKTNSTHWQQWFRNIDLLFADLEKKKALTNDRAKWAGALRGVSSAMLASQVQ